MVTGLVVNDKVNVRSEYYRNARAMCFSLFNTGQYFKELIPGGPDETEPEGELISSLNPLEGILSHIYSITQHEERRDAQKQRLEPRAIRKLYRRFLFYKYFVAPDMPLIVTEGKTDPIYLRWAVKMRTKFHPALGKSGKGGFDHALRYFNYGGSAHEILDLGSGGTSNLRLIPIDYQRTLYPYHKEPRAIIHKPMRFPVIIVLDNDDGLSPIAKVIKEKFRVQISLESTEDFFHVTDNLYVVKTPANAGEKTSIEDLFPEQVLKTQLKGKTFNSANKIDPEREYSKEAFAKSVINPNASTIDFSGFDPLLERILMAIQHYAAKA